MPVICETIRVQTVRTRDGYSLVVLRLCGALSSDGPFDA